MRIALALAALGGVASAGTFEIHPGDDLFARLDQLAAGDTVIVHAGTYATPGLVMVTWTGRADAPIVVRAADGEHVVIQGTPAQNVLDVGGSYFTLQGFEITGGSHGVRLAATDHATLADNTIHGLGDVGISCNRDAQDCSALAIRHNEIYDTGHAGTGEGMYLGCNDGACSFHDSIVESNYVHDLGGDQGDGIEVKTGAYGNVVRDNVIVRSKYPGITMYGFAGAGAPNVVERNLVWHTMDNGIQLVGQVVVQNNLVLDAAASGIASKASQGQTPHDATIRNNTIVGPATCLKTNDWATGAAFVVANNALYCATALDLTGGAAGLTIAGNIGLGASNAPGGFAPGGSIAADLGSATTLYPPAGSALIDAGDPANAAPDDFNATVRDARPDVGAYEHTTETNPGWTIVEGFKPPPVQPVQPDATPIGDPVMAGSGGCCDGGGGGGLPLVVLAALTWSTCRRPSAPRSSARRPSALRR